jgi:hypothetical protein
LAQPKGDQKSEASEATEYDIYDVKADLNPLKTAGSADSVLFKLRQLILFQKGAKKPGKDEWLDNPWTARRTVKQMKNGEVTLEITVLVPIFNGFCMQHYVRYCHGIPSQRNCGQWPTF